MRRAMHILVVIIVILATKVLFNWTDSKWAEDCEDRGGTCNLWQGIGTGLVKHALQRCVQAASLIGGRALMVNAVDDEAAEFWRRRGFEASRDDALILLRSMGDIAASLAETSG